MKRLLISFSGGKTSAYMTQRILRELRDQYDEIKVVFANTGQEHEKTLEYVDACDKHYGFNLVWVEAVINPVYRKPTSFKVVDFASANRDGKPYADVCAKYGLPNSEWPHCTRELKLNAITSYLDSVGWEEGSYKTATGIRADEIDRISSQPHIIHPLIGWRITKPDVIAWEATQPVRLGIPEHFGNCVWCFKKSHRKLATIAREDFRAFDFPARMELLHSLSGKLKDGQARQLFRGNNTTADIVALASREDFEPFVDGTPWRDDTDTGGSCSDSCEIGGEM